MPGPLPNEWGLEPCIDLINTRWRDHVNGHQFHDRLPHPMWRREFLRHWGYRVHDPDDSAAIERLRHLRIILRASLERHMAGRPLTAGQRRELETAMNGPSFRWRIVDTEGKETLMLERTGDPWDIVIADIASSAIRIIGQDRVVKECANPNCTWMFIDTTRGGTRRWCDTSICGSLINVRRFRSTRAYTQHSSKPFSRP
jgi:predicted RNA-binding Zn ribbon-like protein